MASFRTRLPSLLTPRIRIVPQRPNYFAFANKMSSAAGAKVEWLVVIPDKPGMQAKRLEVRAEHLIGAKQLTDAGFIKSGGPIFNEKPEGADPNKFSFYGSTLVCIGSSKEEVLEKLSKDIYVASGVWDLEKVQIWPAKYVL